MEPAKKLTEFKTRRRDTQHNDAQDNDTMHNGLYCDTQQVQN
jgi:hypothetical protein